tara:strand:- start:885 stop:1826 length:942 start_codon:yes stop_codon:yes gene_type:complete
MTFLRYYMPLIIEAKNRGIRSRIFVGRNNKYNNPRSFMDHIENLSDIHEFEILDLNEAHKHSGIVFLIEGVDHDKVDSSKTTTVSLTYMTDYSGLYDSYVNKVDHIVFPSEYFAKIYNKDNPKNLYLGSPKYDLDLDESRIINKYNLTNGKKALIIYPKTIYKSKVDLNRIYSNLKELGYNILVKSRGKDPVTNKDHRGDAYYSDKCWYPHTTMEFIKVSDIVINFNSTSIKESVLLRTPLINFNVKPWMPLGELYEYEYCYTSPNEFKDEEFKSAVNRLTTNDLAESFDKAIQERLFEKNSSKRILDYLEVI